jgi:16S rRNA (cytidine1402-2'-O)-methyltransferase
LQDITLRALAVLKEVDAIACEDTRQTRKLLDQHGITTRMVSYHEHNEQERAVELVAELKHGNRVAVVTDAGMPGISDPGYRVINLAIEQGVPVVPIPGASAFLSALAASGLPTDAFRFAGFLPSRRGERRTVLTELLATSETQIFYEAPHRLLETLEDIVDVLGVSRHVVVAREVTKLHEEFLRGPVEKVLAELASRDEVRGEITLLIARANETSESVAKSKGIHQRLEEVMREESVDEKAALKKVAKEFGLSKSEAYRRLQREK